MYDTKHLSKMKLLEVHASEAMKAFVAFDKAALAEGAISIKYIVSRSIRTMHDRVAHRTRSSLKPSLLLPRCGPVGPSRMAPTQ